MTMHSDPNFSRPGSDMGSWVDRAAIGGQDMVRKVIDNLPALVLTSISIRKMSVDDYT